MVTKKVYELKQEIESLKEERNCYKENLNACEHENYELIVKCKVLKNDKEKAVAACRKYRNLLNSANRETSILRNNMNSLMITYQQNDEALQKALEANALLAGKVEAFEKCLKEQNN